MRLRRTQLVPVAAITRGPGRSRVVMPWRITTTEPCSAPCPLVAPSNASADRSRNVDIPWLSEVPGRRESVEIPGHPRARSDRAGCRDPVDSATPRERGIHRPPRECSTHPSTSSRRGHGCARTVRGLRPCRSQRRPGRALPHYLELLLPSDRPPDVSGGTRGPSGPGRSELAPDSCADSRSRLVSAVRQPMTASIAGQKPSGSSRSLRPVLPKTTPKSSTKVSSNGKSSVPGRGRHGVGGDEEWDAGEVMRRCAVRETFPKDLGGTRSGRPRRGPRAESVRIY